MQPVCSTTPADWAVSKIIELSHLEDEPLGFYLAANRLMKEIISLIAKPSSYKKYFSNKLSWIIYIIDVIFQSYVEKI